MIRLARLLLVALALTVGLGGAFLWGFALGRAHAPVTFVVPVQDVDACKWTRRPTLPTEETTLAPVLPSALEPEVLSLVVREGKRVWTWPETPDAP
jgi:hypothetical protein